MWKSEYPAAMKKRECVSRKIEDRLRRRNHFAFSPQNR
ncbi:hypothetical protein THTE_0155 [Thermogutta terrifontis]|uniref:Uncharacterized protein n=1 Tax=Thermogutta terrifontis TaxID=1331910 RepID=A0A286RA04_9BACT|nr:hypothetical protein THTE_0155 [Thermogutta terrifontis]